MARSWAELLGESGARPESEEERRGLFGRLRESLGKSRRALTEQIVVAAFDPSDD
nr:signal recognition particle-docking protein FtsY [Actinomycetota bacterium]